MNMYPRQAGGAGHASAKAPRPRRLARVNLHIVIGLVVGLYLGLTSRPALASFAGTDVFLPSVGQGAGEPSRCEYSARVLDSLSATLFTLRNMSVTDSRSASPWHHTTM